MGGEVGAEPGEIGGEVGGEVGGSSLLTDLTTRHKDRMGKAAYISLEDEFEKHATTEDLTAERLRAYNHVRMFGGKVCGNCKWRHGCKRCDEAKAWSWACRSTLYEAMPGGVRPTAKPKGRPKKKA